MRRLGPEQLEALAQVYIRGALTLPPGVLYEGPVERRGRPSRWILPRSGYGNRPVLVRLAALKLRAEYRTARARYADFARAQREEYDDIGPEYLKRLARKRGLLPLPARHVEPGRIEAQLVAWGVLRGARPLDARSRAALSAWIGGRAAIDRVILSTARDVSEYPKKAR